MGGNRRTALPLVLLGCWCSVAAAVRFKGFDSLPFEFPGVRGSTYNILSEQNHQLNARLVSEASIDVDAAGGADGATWMGELVFKYKEDVVHVAVDGLGRMAVSANGQPLVWDHLLATTQEDGSSTRTLLMPAGTHLVLSRSASAQDDPLTPTMGSQGADADAGRLLVATPDMTLAVRVAAPRKQRQQRRQQGQQQRRLDVAVLSISPYLCDVHGVLGQTYKRQYGVTPGPFTVEGAVFDYELPFLHSNAFHFNRFRSAKGSGCGASGSSSGEAIEATVLALDGEGQPVEVRPQMQVDEAGAVQRRFLA